MKKIWILFLSLLFFTSCQSVYYIDENGKDKNGKQVLDMSKVCKTVDQEEYVTYYPFNDYGKEYKSSVEKIIESEEKRILEEGKQ